MATAIDFLIDEVVAAILLLNLRQRLGREVVHLEWNPRVIAALKDVDRHVAQVGQDALEDAVDLLLLIPIRRRCTGKGRQPGKAIRVMSAQRPGTVASHGVAGQIHVVRVDLEGAEGCFDEFDDELLGAVVGPAVL